MAINLQKLRHLIVIQKSLSEMFFATTYVRTSLKSITSPYYILHKGPEPVATALCFGGSGGSVYSFCVSYVIQLITDSRT